MNIDNPDAWHFWGRWNQVMLFMSPWHDLKRTDAYKDMNVKLKWDFKNLDGNFYFLESDLQSLYDTLLKNIDNPEWFNRFFSLCDRKTKEILALEHKKDLKHFIKEMVNFLGCSTFIEMMDFYIEKYLEKLCREKNIPFAQIAQQMNPHRKTQLMKYKERLKSLQHKDIDDFVKEYRWVGTHAFEGDPLTRSKVEEELRAMKSKKEGISHRISTGSQEFQNMINIGSQLAFYRSDLMESVDRVSYSYWNLIDEQGKKYDLSFFETISLTHDELIELIDKGTIPPDAKLRKKRFGLVTINGKKIVLLGNELDEQLKLHDFGKIAEMSELKGMVAFPGKVKGMVKVIIDVSDFGKVKEGDIIVAAETTPNFIIALRKAAAIVTNHG